MRDFLADLGLKSFLKSTGGKGLHVVAPITPKLGWDEVKAFAKAVADALVAARPDRYTANLAEEDARAGKIFVDYLRNQRGGSAIVNYSTRARRVRRSPARSRWDELKALKVAAPYDADPAGAAEALKRDPWEGFFSTRQSITAKALKALGLA